MKCPHCGRMIYFEESGSSAYEYEKDEKPATPGVNAYDVAHGFCPSCEQLIVMIREGKIKKAGYGDYLEDIQTVDILFPRCPTRPLEPEVPELYRKEFEEAAGVITISPKASAAISRRLLQHVLREEAKVKKSDLSKEIDEFISRKDVPSYLSQAVDAVRNIGNFAAHPLKETNTGEVVNVENGEAEWLLDVLESMFDFLFVQPVRLAQRKTSLNQKLVAIGKPPMKGT
jgi:hypothetical protein